MKIQIGIKSFNVPASWYRMGWSDRAAYLCSSHQVRSYAEACGTLRMARKNVPRRRVGVAREFWWNRAD